MKTTAKLLLLILTLVSVGVALLLQRGDPPPLSTSFPSSLVNDINVALADFRPTEGRFIGFDYSSTRYPEWKKPHNKLFRLRLRQIEKLAARQPLSNRLGIRALLDFASGNMRDAAAQIERALKLSPLNPWLLTDLSAVYLSRAAAEADPYYLLLALRTAESAVEMSPNLPEARFNRAVALDRLFLKREAISAWTSYLRIDDHGSGWSREAHERLVALLHSSYAEDWQNKKEVLIRSASQRDWSTLREVVKDFAQPTREYAEGELLGDWAEATLKGRNGESERYLSIARGIGYEISYIAHDDMLADAVSAIDKAALAPSKRLTTVLARGHSLYWQGLSENVRLNPLRAKKILTGSQILLREGGSPFEAWARLESSLCDYHSVNYRAVLHDLSELEATLLNRYPVLRGRLAWIRGLVYSQRGRFDLSLMSFESAQINFEHSAQADFLGAIHRTQADDLFLLGDEKRAWTHLYFALRASRESLDHIRMLAAFERAALAAQQEGEPRIAVYFQNEGLLAAGFGKDSRLVAGSFALRAEMQAEAGNMEGALNDIITARKLAGAVDDEEVRRTLSADILRIEGQLIRKRDPIRSTDLLTSAIGIYRRQGYDFYLPRTYLSRALAYSDLGLAELAKADLQTGIDQVERQRRSLEMQLRVSFLDQANELFTQMLRLQLRQGRGLEEAFVTAELSRVRTLSELLRVRGRKTTTVTELKRRLPLKTAVIEFEVLPDQLIIWAIAREQSKVAMVEIAEPTLNQKLNRLHETIAGNDHDWLLASKDVYRILLGPIEGFLSDYENLIFIPHHLIYGVPFSALVNPETDSYLVEGHTIGVAPSSTLLLKVAERPRGLESNHLRVLILGDPEFDRRRSPEVATLKYAKEETEKVASLFPGAEVAAGKDATKARLLSGGNYDIIHFIGHALPNSEFPLLSRLLLAPAERDSGVLFAHELYRQNFQRTRLVTLSACSTAFGTRPSDEGPESLVRPFLANGVPAVVGTLWDVDDRATSDFYITFYAQLRFTHNSMYALRLAQLTFLQNANSYWQKPRFWAAFVHFS